jgi:hypothetical protein
MTSVAQRTRTRRTRAEILRAASIGRREDGKKRRVRNAAEAALPPCKQSALYRLQGALSRQQYEAGCRLRDDYLDHLDAKSGGIPSDGTTGGTDGIPHERLGRQADAWHRYCTAANAVDVTLRSCLIAVCAGDRHPADLARRMQVVTEAAIMLTLRRGLDSLARHYGRTGR